MFNTLFGSASLPVSLREGMADYNMVKCYVLLHDLTKGPADGQVASDGLQEISRAYGAAACKLLPINSRAPEAPLLPDLWTAARPPDFSATTDEHPLPTSPSNLGALLSEGDLGEVRKFVAGTLSKLVLGHLQQRVVQISATVKASRQGVKNMVRSWLGGKKGTDAAPAAPSASATSATGTPRYTANTIEAQAPSPRISLYLPRTSTACHGIGPALTLQSPPQLRQLADYAFMLRDYPTALANYRLAGAEFKSDKAWKHYAGTLEMVALCLYFSDGSRRDMEDTLEKATAHFLRGTSPRHASKATLLQARAECPLPAPPALPPPA